MTMETKILPPPPDFSKKKNLLFLIKNLKKKSGVCYFVQSNPDLAFLQKNFKLTAVAVRVRRTNYSLLLPLSVQFCFFVVNG